MAKTRRIELAEIADWSNLLWAVGRACRGKRDRGSVQGFLARGDAAIAEIARALRAGRLPVGRFRAFVIHDPKRRMIHAAELEDRIAHHALVRHLEPVFERVLLPSVFACRKGKGVHAAIAYAQRQARRFPWVMHLDIDQYFPSMDHDRLGSQLRRRFRGDGLRLMDAVIAAHNGNQGKGLPIGALTSQHFANHYLNPADRWALAQPEVAAHCRYMDDYLIWSNDRAGLRVFRDRFIQFLGDALALAAKPPLIQRSDQGILFCGIHIKPHSLRASQRRRRRFRCAFDHWQQEWLLGRIDELQLQRTFDSARAILLPADDPGWRRQCLSLGARIDA